MRLASATKWLALIAGLESVGCGVDEAPVAADATRPSCAQLDECQGGSCCKSFVVPAQAFTLGGSVESPSSEARVSAFTLDAHEVTVGRFRAFARAYDAWRAAGNPQPGAGAHPLIADSGWKSEWTLLGTAAELESEAGVACTALNHTYDAGIAQLPVNCVTWLEAFAFCVWDGGRLPTESEWEAAASGGDQRWPFAWGPSAPDASRAAYDCVGDGSAAQECALSDILAVGSKPAGAGRWGHFDLAGNVWEWVLDAYRAYPPTAADWANVEDSAYRTIRGSGWYSTADDLRSPIRYNSAPSARRAEFGFRCAR